MAIQVDIRRELTVGRHALDPARVCEVAEWIASRPRRIPALIELMWDDDPGVSSRAADVLERVSRWAGPALARAIAEYKDALIGLLSEATLPKVRWNLALTIPRLTLTVADCRRTAAVLETWFDHPSSIVKTSALHALADLTRQNPASKPEVLDLLRVTGRSGTPAMRARSRILLKAMEKPAGKRQEHGSLHMFD